MLVELDELVEFMDDETLVEGTVLDSFSNIHTEIESIISRYCRRTFESTSYVLEKYDGNGGRYLYLNQYPVTALDRLAIGTEDIIQIQNTSDYTTASVSVTSTGLRLVKDRVADVSILFATYTTMTTVVSAINALGSGWYAELSNSTYGSWNSNELLQVYGLNVIDSNYVYLKVPYTAESGFDLDLATGRVYKASGFTEGISNIFVDYTAGYVTIPDDLQNAVKIFVKSVWQKKTNEAWNIRRYTIGDITYEFGAGSGDTESIAIPIETSSILALYKKRLV